MTVTTSRKQRVRFAIKKRSGGKPRLSVFRSNKHIHAQVIDDIQGVTLASASTLGMKSSGNIDAAKVVGQLIAKVAKSKKVSHVVFDRGACLYHGRIKAVADAARAEGLIF
jgi:large subunit ribosomal protein L18